jgi:hypothetical protein
MKTWMKVALGVGAVATGALLISSLRKPRKAEGVELADVEPRECKAISVPATSTARQGTRHEH